MMENYIRAQLAIFKRSSFKTEILASINYNETVCTSNTIGMNYIIFM